MLTIASFVFALLIAEGRSQTVACPGQAGNTMSLQCPGSSTRFFTVTCLQSGSWDFSNQQTECAGSLTIIGTVPGTQSPPPPASPPAPVISYCVYIPSNMPSSEMGRTFPEGAVYQMMCGVSGQTFTATCENGAWVYPTNSCSYAPTAGPPTAGPPTAGPPPPQASTGAPPAPCSYMRLYIHDEDAGKTFSSGDLYEMDCLPPYESNTFIAQCVNGQWIGDQSRCSGGGLFNIFTPRNPQPVLPLTQRDCMYMPTVMDESDAGKTFPHGRRYQFKCLQEDAVYTRETVECRDGTWYHFQNSCFGQREGPLQGGISIGGSQIPLWLLLLRG